MRPESPWIVLTWCHHDTACYRVASAARSRCPRDAAELGAPCQGEGALEFIDTLEFPLVREKASVFTAQFSTFVGLAEALGAGAEIKGVLQACHRAG